MLQSAPANARAAPRCLSPSENGLRKVDRSGDRGSTVTPNTRHLWAPTVDPKPTPPFWLPGIAGDPARRRPGCLSPDEAEEFAREVKQVVLVRQETRPDDFHGMFAAQAIVTPRFVMTRHACSGGARWQEPASAAPTPEY